MPGESKKSARETFLDGVVLTLRANEIRLAERIVQLEQEVRELLDKDLKQQERLNQIRDMIAEDLSVLRDSVSHYSRSQAFDDAIEEIKRTFEKIKRQPLPSSEFIDPEKEKEASKIMKKKGLIPED